MLLTTKMFLISPCVALTENWKIWKKKTGKGTNVTLFSDPQQFRLALDLALVSPLKKYHEQAVLSVVQKRTGNSGSDTKTESSAGRALD